MKQLVCPNCGIYDRLEAFDGRNHYTVCARCGRAELLDANPRKGWLRRLVGRIRR